MNCVFREENGRLRQLNIQAFHQLILDYGVEDVEANRSISIVNIGYLEAALAAAQFGLTGDYFGFFGFVGAWDLVFVLVGHRDVAIDVWLLE